MVKFSVKGSSLTSPAAVGRERAQVHWERGSQCPPRWGFQGFCVFFPINLKVTC